jgi:hypothetical protein
VEGSYAYLAVGGGGLRIANIATPANPIEVATLSLFGYAVNITVANDYAYVAALNGGLRLVNISNVIAPVEEASFNRVGTSVDVGIDERGFAWLADTDGGLYAVTADLTVSGQVTDHNYIPFPGAAIIGTAGRQTTTNLDGTYQMTGFLPDFTYQITPTLPGYTFWPPTRSFFLPDSLTGQNFIILPGPVETTIFTGTTATLSYTDVQGLPTTFEFAAGTVTQTTAVTVTPIFVSGSADAVFAGHGFDLSAVQGGNAIVTFNRPVTITISYSDLDIRLVTAENALTLRRWDGLTWQDAAQSCTPATTYQRDLVNNTITLPVCQSGRYALFGPSSRVFMAMVYRN